MSSITGGGATINGDSITGGGSIQDLSVSNLYGGRDLPEGKVKKISVLSDIPIRNRLRSLSRRSSQIDKIIPIANKKQQNPGPYFFCTLRVAEEN